MLFVSCTFQNISNARNTHFNRNILTVSAFADTKRNALWTLSDKKQYCGQMKHLWQLQAENMRLHNGCTFVRRIANPPIRFSWHCYGKCTTLTTPHADCKSSRTQRIYSYPTHVKYFALKLRMNPTLTLPEYPWRERNILPVWKKTRFSASNVTHWQTEHYANQCNKMKHTARQKATFCRLKYGLSASKRPSTASLSTAYKHSKPHYFANRTWQNRTLYNNKGKWDDKNPPCDERSLEI